MKKKLRSDREIEEALVRLQALEGDPVVDAVVATLRWVLKKTEWREAFGALAEKHAEPEVPPEPSPPHHAV